ncbi:cupredoxin domain-containing protein [Burkholderia stagnalis]|uniref:cupredoxin domain-containing protein n=1 Tax=Burkholderia stagnalis TaxID=1503054 RepID=UPI000F58763A|nr:cupredoxin domain-containing protein [Burkholderia stagnalis]RQQ34791.1 quinol oxidase [Burkholderia stagnalis]RQQ38546.1 quinol oxidase [Burkholderia stagnalis]RQQ53685.1 quinol oxidase [Burkholderia stagnalis]RQY02126.1 quinol oxidase [Burkholderia stagnalis]RQY18155.1 quinol oxidase [Burkholderia stagnalis]
MTRMARILLIALAACAGAARAAEDVPVHVPVDADGVQRVVIVGGSYFFRPNHVIVKARVPVELTVSNETGLISHNFAIDAPQAGIAVRTELTTAPKTFRFTPTQAGRFAYYCTHRLLLFKSHRDRGMEGVLEVEEGP